MLFVHLPFSYGLQLIAHHSLPSVWCCYSSPVTHCLTLGVTKYLISLNTSLGVATLLLYFRHSLPTAWFVIFKTTQYRLLAVATDPLPLTTYCCWLALILSTDYTPACCHLSPALTPAACCHLSPALTIPAICCHSSTVLTTCCLVFTLIPALTTYCCLLPLILSTDYLLLGVATCHSTCCQSSHLLCKLLLVAALTTSYLPPLSISCRLQPNYTWKTPGPVFPSFT